MHKNPKVYRQLYVMLAKVKFFINILKLIISNFIF